jgi:putative transposase
LGKAARAIRTVSIGISLISVGCRLMQEPCTPDQRPAIRRQYQVFIRIQGVQHYLWRAVDQDGVVLDILVQTRRDAQAAKRFFKRLLKGLEYEPRVIVTDKLRSYGVAQRQLLPGVEHRQSRYLNNRAENSHQPTRRRERQMQRFKSSRQAQDFLSAHSFIYGHFHPRRHRLAADVYREIRSVAFNVWHQETCTRKAA